MDNLIDLELQDEDEPAIQHLKMFEQADAQRNQLVKVRLIRSIDANGSPKLISHCRNYVMKSKT